TRGSPRKLPINQERIHRLWRGDSSRLCRFPRVLASPRPRTSARKGVWAESAGLGPGGTAVGGGARTSRGSIPDHTPIPQPGDPGASTVGFDPTAPSRGLPHTTGSTGGTD